MLLKSFLVCVVLVAISGCSKDEFYRNIYDGLRNRAELEDPERKGPPAAEDTITYDRYKMERERALKRDGEDIQ